MRRWCRYAFGYAPWRDPGTLMQHTATGLTPAQMAEEYSQMEAARLLLTLDFKARR
jgi:hypothetical protein